LLSFRQITAEGTAAPAATVQYVSIAEAEKLTAATLTSGSTQKQKPRTPSSKIYNWDG